MRPSLIAILALATLPAVSACKDQAEDRNAEIEAILEQAIATIEEQVEVHRRSLEACPQPDASASEQDCPSIEDGRPSGFLGGGPAYTPPETPVDLFPSLRDTEPPSWMLPDDPVPPADEPNSDRR